jgi:hypothetical protein
MTNTRSRGKLGQDGARRGAAADESGSAAADSQAVGKDERTGGGRPWSNKWLDGLAALLTWQRQAGLAAALLLAALAVTLWRPAGGPVPVGGSELVGWSPLVVSPAHAADNFTLEPTDADDLGVAPDSAYVLTSRDALATEEVRAALRVEPAVEFDLTPSGDRQWRLEPRAALLPNQNLRIELAAEHETGDGARATRLYSWAYQVKDSFKVLTSVPRDQATGVPTNTGIEFTFSHVGVETLGEHFSITPPVPGRFEAHGRTVAFVPTEYLRPATVYTVTLAAGLRPAGAEAGLAADYAVRFETAEVEDGAQRPMVHAVERLHEFAPDDAPAFSVYEAFGADPAAVRVTVYDLGGTDAYLQALREWNERPWWSGAYGRYRRDTSALREVAAYELPVADYGDGGKYLALPAPLPRGTYVIDIESAGGTDQVWAQVTELAAFVNVTATKTLVWVNDRATGLPAAGVTLTGEGAALSGRTGPDGLAVVETPPTLREHEADELAGGHPYVRLARGGDEVVLPLTGNDYYRGWGDYWVNRSVADRYWRYLSTDRPRYQVDDTVHVWGVLKPRAGGTMGSEVTLALRKEGYRDYYYRPVDVWQSALALGADGSFTIDIPLRQLRPDYYALDLMAGGELLQRLYLNVEPYEKPAYDLSVTAARSHLFAGETVPVTVEAKFFDGTPAVGVQLTFTDDAGRQQPIVTDSAGRYTLDYQPSFTGCGDDAWQCWPKGVYLSVRSSQAERGEISAFTQLNVFGPAVYARADVKYPAAGAAEVHFDFNRVDLAAAARGDGYGDTPAGGTEFDLTVTKTWYEAVEIGTRYDFVSKTTGKAYRYVQHEEAVERLSGRADGAGEYVYRRAVEKDVSYQVRARYKDADGRQDSATAYLYHFDGNETWDGWPGNGAYQLDLGTDEPYGIGERVHVTMRRGREALPGGGGNRYLFMQYQNGLRAQAVADGPDYEFAFAPEHVPNVFLGAVWFNGRAYVSALPSDYGWFGSSMARADVGDRELRVDLSTDRAAYAPGDEAAISVRVTDAAGRPVAGSVNLSLIDEAYFAVADVGLPNPLGELYANVGSGSFFARQTHEMPSEAAAAEGGGCFAAGTLITMADGSTKPIERVAVGDAVGTFDGPLSRRRAVGSVTEVIEHTVGTLLVINERLRVTPEHRVFVSGGFAPAGEIRVGDRLLGEDGREVAVRSVRAERGRFAVYNFRVDPQHTYFAEGLYVHNDKGGVRSAFADVAYSGSLVTGADGRGAVTLKLPDNITAWRMTAQAVTGDLRAGAAAEPLVVTKDVFVDVAGGLQFLAGDRPALRLTAYGEALRPGSAVRLSVSAPSLGIEAERPGTAFVGERFDLGELAAGTHGVTCKAESAAGADAVRLPLTVVDSRLRVQDVTAAGPLTTATAIEPAAAEPLSVVLMDDGRNEHYPLLRSLAWSWGHRVDQHLAARTARRLLAAYYGEAIEGEDETVDWRSYQDAAGGLTLLPYSGADLELSARLADLDAGPFDRVALAQYFYAALNSTASTPDEVTWSLYGLASLGEPVLPQLHAWSRRADLPPTARLYVALALLAAGDGERARTELLSTLGAAAVVSESQTAMRVGDDDDANLHATALAAVAAGGLNLPEHAGLWRYVAAHRSRTLLPSLEQASYAAGRLPYLNPAPTRVTYELGGLAQTVDLTGGTHGFLVYPQEAASLRFTAIEGAAAYTVRASRPASDGELRLSGDLRLDRQYLVDGEPTTAFAADDLVEVRLTPHFGSAPGREAFQLTDNLPSGLALVGAPWDFLGYAPGGCYWSPYAAGASQVSFLVEPSALRGRCGSVTYWARVTTSGTFRAEPALLQSFLAPETRTASDGATVTIE